MKLKTNVKTNRSSFVLSAYFLSLQEYVDEEDDEEEEDKDKV